MSCTILLAGIGTSAYFYASGAALGEKMPEFLKLGPAFISCAVTSLPVKAFFDCLARLNTYLAMEQSGIHLTEAEIKALFTQILTESLKATVKI